MRVIKRNGEFENVSFDKVLNRLKYLSEGIQIDICEIAQKVCGRIFDGVKTSDLDELAAHLCSSLLVIHPDYGRLASKIIISNHHKNTSPSFSETIHILYHNPTGPLVAKEIYDIVQQHKEKLNSYIDYSRDYFFDYFGFKTLERSYLLKSGGKIVERPQQMWMRVALGIHKNDIKDALQTYDLMSQKYFTHATPTLFNSGTPRPQNSSCFLLSMRDDSISGIYDSLKDVALISKYAGGIGIHMHQIRAKGSVIRGTNGISSGIVPMLRVFNNTARYVDQAGKRLGSIAVYLEPHHADIEQFLELRKNHGNEEERCRDLFLALWVPDLFMERVRDNGVWSLMCPDQCPGLSDVWGEEFNKLYASYEEKGQYVKQVKAQDLWFKILESQIETGVPYICYKDHVNRKSNQQNLGTIKSSNLCVEIMEKSTPDEIAVCLTGDTEILTEYGIRKIEDIQDEKIFSYFGDDVKLTKEEGLFNGTLINNGVKDVYEIKFVGSKPIKATANHKFLIFSKRNYNMKKNTYEWKELKDLTIKDRIIMPSNSPLEHFKDIEIEKNVDTECLSLGWIIGDGWQNYNDKSERTIYGVCFGPNEVKARDIVLNELNKIHQKLPITKGGHQQKSTTFYTDKRSDVHQWATSKKSFIDYFKDKYDLQPRLGKNKSFSQKIKYLQPNQIASILSGYFSADGSVYLNTEKNNKFYVSLSSASEDLLYDVQSLLRCFGIASRIVFSEVKGRGRSQGHLTIYNRTNLQRFQKYINFMLCDDKKIKLEYGLSLMTGKHANHEKDWCSIRSITYVGKEQVYDLNIPQTHNFIANGMVTHNCNLSSVCLPSYVENGVFNFEKLHNVAKVITKNLNKVIDGNYYPLEEARRSNLKHRPVGIGINGLSDLFMILRIPFESAEARELNKQIFETLYHGALESSMEIAKKRHISIQNNEPLEMMNEYEPLQTSTYPGAYSSFEGSPVSKGTLQFDMWGVQPSSRYDWNHLKEEIQKYGIRNSLLLAPMPTASTAQIMGFNESFEPITSNIFKRKTLSGEFIVVNKYLIKDLIDLGLWGNEMKDRILLNDGSVQNIEEIPPELKELYKTVWEIKQKTLIDLSADRGAYICQSQSLNIFIEEPDYKKLTSMHFYGWSKGLKTGSYYIRTKPKAKTQQFTIDPDFAKKQQEKKPANIVCTEEVCTMCSA
jgi:ribonucleotide reductase alpha subunit